MTHVIYLLVQLTDVLRSLLTLMLLTCQTSITMLLDTRVHPHMMQEYSTAHMFHYRWFVLSIQIHSNPRLDSRHVMAWFQTHSSQQTVHTMVLQTEKLLQRMPTCTTAVYRLSTSCNSELHTHTERDPSGSLFLSKY